METVRDAVNELSCAFEEFKSVNDAKLHSLEKTGKVDNLIEQKLSRLNAEVDRTYDQLNKFEWKKVDVLLKDYKTGEALFDQKDLEFPVQYSQNACDIIGSKYFKRANVPNDRGMGKAAILYPLYSTRLSNSE